MSVTPPPLRLHSAKIGGLALLCSVIGLGLLRWAERGDLSDAALRDDIGRGRLISDVLLLFEGDTRRRAAEALAVYIGALAAVAGWRWVDGEAIARALPDGLYVHPTFGRPLPWSAITGIDYSAHRRGLLSPAPAFVWVRLRNPVRKKLGLLPVDRFRIGPVLSDDEAKNFAEAAEALRLMHAKPAVQD